MNRLYVYVCMYVHIYIYIFIFIYLFIDIDLDLDIDLDIDIDTDTDIDIDVDREIDRESYIYKPHIQNPSRGLKRLCHAYCHSWTPGLRSSKKRVRRSTRIIRMKRSLQWISFGLRDLGFRGFGV